MFCFVLSALLKNNVFLHAHIPLKLSTNSSLIFNRTFYQELNRNSKG
jgi:hypothetical protein